MRYREALTQTIAKWNEYPITNEWLFVEFRENFVSTMSSIEAFDSINNTIDVLLSQDDESTATEVIETLISLAKQSETTEAPNNLFINKTNLVLHFSNFGEYAKNKLRELFSYYRFE